MHVIFLLPLINNFLVEQQNLLKLALYELWWNYSLQIWIKKHKRLSPPCRRTSVLTSVSTYIITSVSTYVDGSNFCVDIRSNFCFDVRSILTYNLTSVSTYVLISTFNQCSAIRFFSADNNRSPNLPALVTQKFSICKETLICNDKSCI